ncbi:MAG: DUF3592 domain-containing protein [Alphaproteobacteria bacterium]|nr:DUF3592 domain-containing protein [Alphaproteobacteria bacterium]
MDTTLKDRSDITVILVLFISLAIAGVLGGGFIVRDYAHARASVSWPQVDGVVLSQLGDGSKRLRYAYSIGGRTYESHRERFFTGRFSKSQALEYFPGETLTVYVDPQHHTFSVLKTGGAGAAFVLFSLFSGACIFFGVGGVVWTLSERAAEPSPDTDAEFSIRRDAHFQ